MLKQLFNGRDPQAIFFDLDGTLVDSLKDLSTAIDLTLAELGLNEAGENLVMHWIGNGAKKLVSRALAHAKNTSQVHLDATQLESALEFFYKHYSQVSGSFSQLYPYVHETLSALKARNIKLCIITNKPKRFTPQVLYKHDLTKYFSLVISGDSLAQMKPHPAPLQFALNALHTQAKLALMVGDSSNDVLAAQAAGIQSICVSYGYNYGNNCHDLPASACITSLKTLICD